MSRLSPDTVTVRPVAELTPEVLDVMDAHRRHSAEHYPSESDYSLSVEDHFREGFQLFSAWMGAQCVGIIGLRAMDAVNAELKSMHVLETVRGAGVGRKLLDEILVQSRRFGYAKLWLETGTRPASAAARRLYAQAGFRKCPPFEGYAEDPESVFMVLDLR